MTGNKHTTSNPLLFSRGERNGLIGLLLITMLVIIVPSLLIDCAEKRYIKEQTKKDSLLMVKVDAAYQQELLARKDFSGTRLKEHTVKAATKSFLVNLNAASSAELEALPGIGAVLSKRIIKFRDQLGGFVSVDQLKEVYGLPVETYLMIKKQVICDNKYKKININSAMEEELDGHPYISSRLAKQMITYRQKVHPFSKVEDLKALYLMNDTLYQKLSFYISVE